MNCAQSGPPLDASDRVARLACVIGWSAVAEDDYRVPTGVSERDAVADRGVRTAWDGGETLRPRHPDAVKQHVGDALALAAPYLA